MGYTIYSQSGMEPLDSLQLHVLARAYGVAWRAVRGCEPSGLHVIEALDLAIVFGNEQESVLQGDAIQPGAVAASRSATCRSSAGTRASGRSVAKIRARR